MNDQLEYDRKIEIIEKLINNIYPNDTFMFEKMLSIYDEKIKYFTKIMINDICSITILPNNTWKEIKRNIDTKLKNMNENNKIECMICLDTECKSVSCNKCSNFYCVLCYVEIFKKNKGIIVCPYCRYSIGMNVPDHMIEECVQNILMTADEIYDI